MSTFNDEIERAVAEAAGDGTFSTIPVYSHFFEISENEVDVWGHANNVCYLHWMQNVAVAHSAAIGWTPERYLDFGAIWVVRRHSIEYRQSAFRGERLIAQTWVPEMKNVSCVRRYRFLRAPEDCAFQRDDGSLDWAAVAAFEFPKTAIVATAETLWGFVSVEKQRPVRVAPKLRAAFELAVDSGLRFPEFDENRLR